MSSLLPRNATSAERAIEEAISRLDDVPVPLRTLWNADTCPIELLPWLAWALSIDAWKSYWPEHVRRARVRTAIDIQRRKGTSDSVRKVIEAFGGSVQLREWWQQEPRGVPHTFEMVVTVSGGDGEVATAQFVTDVITEVERTKPVRSHFNFTQGLQAIHGIGVAAAVRVAAYRRLGLQTVNEEDIP